MNVHIFIQKVLVPWELRAPMLHYASVATISSVHTVAVLVDLLLITKLKVSILYWHYILTDPTITTGS
jgi:hypothetical protein